MATSNHPHFSARDFDVATRRALLQRGIQIIGLTLIPDDGPMPTANGENGYALSVRGQHQIRRHSEVIALAQEPMPTRLPNTKKEFHGPYSRFAIARVDGLWTIWDAERPTDRMVVGQFEDEAVARAELADLVAQCPVDVE